MAGVGVPAETAPPFGCDPQGEFMPSRSMPSFARTWRGLAIAAALLFSAQAHAQSAGPFAALPGSWSGGGTISLSSGANERIRCRAAYEVGSGARVLQLRAKLADRPEAAGRRPEASKAKAKAAAGSGAGAPASKRVSTSATG